MKLMGVYSSPGRDPRGRSITIVFIAEATGRRPKSGSDAAAIFVFDPHEIPEELAFDHAEILRDYLSLRDRRSFEERPLDGILPRMWNTSSPGER